MDGINLELVQKNPVKAIYADGCRVMQYHMYGKDESVMLGATLLEKIILFIVKLLIMLFG